MWAHNQTLIRYKDNIIPYFTDEEAKTSSLHAINFQTWFLKVLNYLPSQPKYSTALLGKKEKKEEKLAVTEALLLQDEMY